MLRYWRLTLTLALLSVVAQPSAAQNTLLVGLNSDSSLFSGNNDEILEIALLLDQRVEVEGLRRDLPADCGASFTFEARDATGASPLVFSEFIDLSAGEHHVILLPFANFVPDGPSHVIVEIIDFRQFGNCQLLSFLRLFEAATGATRAGEFSPMRVFTQTDVGP